MNPGPEADRVLLAQVRDCLDRILEYTNSGAPSRRTHGANWLGFAT